MASPRKTPSTVLARLDPGAFERCLLSWIQAVQAVTANRLVAIDGKTLRGSYDREHDRAAIHMVSAWATEDKLSLGQVVVEEKSNEITAIPELLQLLEISGALVTIDAMGCQKEIAEQIRQAKADYILTVKQNQPTLYEQIEEAIDAALEQNAEEVAEHQTVEKGHGRHETRTYAIFPRPESVDPQGLWRDLTRRGDRDFGADRLPGTGSMETRYYILSRRITVQEFAGAVRGHWGIENNLHWQLDVSFREDECRVCVIMGRPTSVIHRFALGLLKRETSCRKGIDIKRMKCTGNDEYREKVLFTCSTKNAVALIGYLTKHSEAGRLRYDCFRYRGVPRGVVRSRVRFAV